jgi:hypothetical protein
MRVLTASQLIRMTTKGRGSVKKNNHGFGFRRPKIHGTGKHSRTVEICTKVKNLVKK